MSAIDLFREICYYNNSAAYRKLKKEEKMKVTILETKNASPWSDQEINTLAANNIEVECLASKPDRIVAMNKPNGKTFRQILGHNNFTEREVEMGDRWR